MFNKRFIKCIIGAVCIFILVITLIGGKAILEKKTALEVINKFFQSNYEYTKVSSSNYSYSDEDVVYKGKIIYEPYQEIEEYVSGSSIIKTVYTYEEKMYSTINVNYYLGMKNKKVVKIIIDDSEYQQDYQILQKMENENNTEDEARKQFIESNESVKSITTITVSNIDESTKN